MLLQNASDEKYDIKICVEEAAIIVSCDKEPFTTCTITLTSPIMRETNIPEGGKIKLTENNPERNLSFFASVFPELS